MRLISSSVLYSLSFYGFLSALYQVQVDSEFLSSLIQIPMVAGLIYLVLKLEDKRQAGILPREETFRQIVSSLLEVIMELSTLANSGNITNKDVKRIEEHLRGKPERKIQQ